MPQSRPDQSSKPRTGWGGKRAGSGARVGNLNALKHGVYSRQMQEVRDRLAQDPQVRRVLLRLRQAADTRRLTLDAGSAASRGEGS